MLTNETLRVIRQRRSNRSFQQEQIAEGALQSILEAGMYAPNAGDQAWHFTVVQDKALLRRINLAAKEAALQMGIEGLKNIAGSEAYDCTYGAPTLVIVSADGRSPIPLDVDCAAATQNMLLAAQSLGLGSCWIYFVIFAFQSSEGEALRKELRIPEGYNPTCSAVFGNRSQPPADAPPRKPGLVTILR